MTNSHAGSATGFDLAALSTYDPDRYTPGMMEQRDTYKDGDYYKVEDVQRALARATPQHPRPTDDELWDATLRDRDQYHEWADKLSGAIAIHFGVDIGEHSNMNLPWAEALDAIESAPPPAAADAATPQHSVTEQAEDLRAAFEKYCGPRDSFAWRNPDDSYKSQTLQSAWELWQAATEAALSGLITKPFAGPGKWFSVDVLGNPMREYEPGKWENCIWPSSRASTAASEQQAGADESKIISKLELLADVIAGEKLPNCANELRKLAAALTHRATTATCGTCDGNGVIGFPPDQYEHCPECAPQAAPDTATTAADQQGAAQAQAGTAPALMRGAVGSVASNVDGAIRINWMRSERVEAGDLLYVIDRAAMAAPGTRKENP